VAVGVLNVAFGVISLVSDLVRLAPGAAVGLVVAGTLTVVGGWFVWQGNRRATIVALAVFVWLLVVQIADVATHVAEDVGGDAATGGIAGRFVVIVLVLVVLAVALLQLRSRPPDRRPS
jgi:hypothetical protein